FCIGRQRLEIGDQIPTFFFCELQVESGHPGSRYAFTDSEEPHLIAVLFEERSGEVSRLLQDGKRVRTITLAFQTVAGSAVLSVDTSTCVGGSIGISVYVFALSQLTTDRRRGHVLFGSFHIVLDFAVVS